METNQATNATIVEEETIPLAEAKKVAAEMRAANAERKTLIEREEKLAAIRMLGGKSAGGQTPQKSEAEIKQEQAKNFWKGTEIEKAISKYG